MAADHVAIRSVVAFRRRESRNDNSAAPRSIRNQPLPSEGGRLNSRKGTDLLHQLFVEARQAFGRVSGWIESKLQDVIGAKSDVDAAKIVEGADEETRAGEQHQRDRHLNADHDFSAGEAADVLR